MRVGREQQSRTCIAANHSISGVDGFGCAINPATANEERWGPTKLVPAPRQMRVVVVGGAPTGLEAARVAALRGHDVTLLERRAAIGGALDLWARLPGRAHLATAL